MPRDYATRGRTRALAPRDKPPIIRDIANTCSSFFVRSSATQPTAPGSPTQAGMPRKRRRPIQKQRPKQHKKTEVDDDWCEIKGILDQREVDGQIQYLVDWEDHPETGEVYPHEWKIKADLSEESIAQWEDSKRRQAVVSPALDQQQTPTENEIDGAEESQEPRPACNRRRSSLPLGKRPRPSPLESEEEGNDIGRPAKRTRLSSEVESAPSFASSVATASEEPDSPLPAHTRTYCQVVLDHKSDFDPSEYHSVKLTQSTDQHSSQSVSALESQDQNIVLGTSDSQHTIPDSQEVSSLETQDSRLSGTRAVGNQESQVSAASSHSQTLAAQSQHPAPAFALPSATIPDSLPGPITGSGDFTHHLSTPNSRSEGDRRPSGPTERSEDSIPSHQAGPSQGYSWAFGTQTKSLETGEYYSQSRVAMSTPRESPGPPPLQEQSSSRQGDSSVSHANTAYLTQPDQPIEEPEPALFSSYLTAERERLRLSRAKSSSEDDEADEDEDDEDNDDEASNGVAHATGHNLLPETVAPADIESAQPTTEIPVRPSIDLSGNSTSIPHPLLDHPETLIGDEEPIVPTSPCILTLPLVANLREEYAEEIECEEENINRWNDTYLEGANPELDEEASAAVDRIFSRLQNKCDYPTGDIQDILDLPLPSRVNWWVSACPKATFIWELLTYLGESVSLKMLIVVDTAYLLERLCEMMERTETVDYTCNKLNRSFNRPTSTVHVTLALLDDQVDAWDADIVIAYNRAFNGSDLECNLRTETQGGRKRPLILKLVTSQTIEHADVELQRSPHRFDTTAERKQALLLILVENRASIRNPPRSRGENPEEPVRLAEEFGKYLLGLIDFSDMDIEPETLAVPVETALESTQPPSPRLEPENGRKRQRDEGEEDEEAKRLRRYSQAQTNASVLPLDSDLQQFLEQAGWKGVTGLAEAQVSLPFYVLERIRAQFTGFERVIEDTATEKDIQRELVETMRAVDKDQQFYDRVSEQLRQAYSERTAANDRAQKADTALAQRDLDHTKVEEKSRARIEELEAQIARLQSGTGTAETERSLKEAQDKATLLEKRLRTAQQNEEYVREKYQESSSAGQAALAEKEELNQVIESLQKEADKNRVEIQKVNNQHSTMAFQSQIAELETRLEFSKSELDRLHEENRQLKNRRETRQGSTPRSPRPGLMSPRGRGGAPLSREGSPILGGFAPLGGNGGIAGVQYTSQNGGGRWGRGQVP